MGYNKEYRRAYYLKNKERELARMKAYRVNNPHFYHERYKKNRLKILAERKAFYQKNKAKIRAYFNATQILPSRKFSYYKANAKRDGRSFSLSYEQFLTLYGKPCFYCGDAIISIGIDRVDNTRGYEISNVVPCCRICNTWKLAMSQSDFIAHVTRISEKCRGLLV